MLFAKRIKISSALQGRAHPKDVREGFSEIKISSVLQGRALPKAGREGLIFILILASCFLNTAFAQEPEIKLDKAPIDVSDYPSLQRGARTFMNYCSGCHTLNYVRYEQLGKGIGITDEQGALLEWVIKQNLMFSGEKLSYAIQTPMPPKEAEKWFGVTPPDLSLASRSRGPDWIYTYLRTFYQDKNRPWGVNNLTFPDVAMPHILINEQGLKGFQSCPVGEELTSAHLDTIKPGSLNDAEYDELVGDLVNFLTYVGEPMQEKRRYLGVWVLLFLGVFTLFAYLLKREFWKQIH